jgi:F-type H+-transporting ATPase subunit b
VIQEQEEFEKKLRARAAESILAITRRLLADLADARLEEQIIESFLQRLKSLDRESRKALQQTTGPVSITTSFALEPGLRARLTRAVHEHLISGAEVEYGEATELLCGIELTAGGHRLGWSLADYLKDLSAGIEEHLAGNRKEA